MSRSRRRLLKSSVSISPLNVEEMNGEGFEYASGILVIFFRGQWRIEVLPGVGLSDLILLTESLPLVAMMTELSFGVYEC
jgi:hypothetical protein